jgi:hypothetical protein
MFGLQMTLNWNEHATLKFIPNFVTGQMLYWTIVFHLFCITHKAFEFSYSDILKMIYSNRIH